MYVKSNKYFVLFAIKMFTLKIFIIQQQFIFLIIAH